MVPLMVMYLYGPRTDRPRHCIAGGWRPRHRVTPDVLWIAAVPAGLVAYLAYLWIATGDPLSAFSAQGEWSRTVIPLVGGIALGAWEAITGVVELLPGFGSTEPLADGQVAEFVALRNVILFGFLLLAGWLVKESARRLPVAYTAWTVTGLLLPLSVPALDEPLKSLPRFMLVLFPLWIALALWAQERGRLRRVLVVMGTLLVISTGLFATWVHPP